MANTISVHQMIATAAAKQLADTNPLFTTVSREGEGEFGKTINGHKPGDTIKVRVPSMGTVQDGATAVPDDINETNVDLTIDIRKNVSFALTTHESTLKMTSIERLIEQKVAQLSADIHNEMLSRVDTKVSQRVIGSAGAGDDYFDASAILTENMAPGAGRYVVASAREKARVGKDLHNQWTQPSDVQRKSTVGMHAGFEFNEVSNITSVINGNKVASVAVSAVPSAGATTITFKALTSGDTFLKGQTFTVPGVYAVNPLTGASTSELRRFVVTADATASGATKAVSVYPAFIVGETVSAMPAVDAVIAFDGAADARFNGSIAYHKDAFRLAFVELKVPEDKKGYTLTKNGFSIRVYSGSDTLTDVSTTRIDIACGIAVVRPDWACRVLA